MLIKTTVKTIKRYRNSIWKPALLVCGFILLPLFSFAIKEESADEEISVTIELKTVGTLELPAIYHNKEVYLSVTHVLDFIKAKNTPSPYFDSVSGYYMNEKDLFVIDESHSRIIYNNKEIKVDSGDLIRSETNLYMNLKYFKSVFGLDGSFNFRRLWVVFTTDLELPIMREMRLELMRKNVTRLRGEQKADTTIKRKYPAFHFGAVDWSVLSTQQSGSFDDTRFNLGLGAVILGGETDLALNYYSRQPFNELQQYYQWRYVNNDYAALKQVALGKIFTQSISTLYAPVVGIQVSNSPTTYRQAYGTYTLSDKTEPGWIVELYVNEVLVDYKKADASGFFTFDVPLFYGYTTLKLRFYGPYGEERISRRFVNIPFNFLPKHTYEYNISAGIVEDGRNSIFTRVANNYGLTSRITVGAGVEYLTSVTSGNTMPFINSSMRVTNRLMLSGEYTHGVRGRGILSYRLPSNIQFDFDYTKYTRGQTAIYYNYLEERKATLTVPLRIQRVTLFSRMIIDDIVVPLSHYTNTELAFTGSVGSVGFNLSTYASFAKAFNPYFYTLGAISLMLPKKINFTTQAQYDYKASKIAFVKLTFEKYLFVKGFVNISYQEFFTNNNEYFRGNYRNLLVGLRYDLSFARLNVSALTGSNKTYSRMEAASGSFVFDHKTHYTDINNRTNVGKGGIVVVPFLDINCNGKRDKDEPNAPGLQVRVNGGRITYDKRDSSIRIADLEPYTNYYVELNNNSFDNIAWQLKAHTIKVTVAANNYTLVEVPVYVVGEVSGEVMVKNKETKKIKGQGQIIINIFTKAGALVTRIVSETDGYFSFIGLAPGSYIARIDDDQLKKLHMSAEPIPFDIHIMKGHDGDVVSGIEFLLQPAD